MTSSHHTASHSAGHYDLDAKTFAEWGADYVKVDYCGYCSKTATCEDPRDLSIEPEVQYAAFAAFRDALNKTGRPIYYSICPHRQSNGKYRKTKQLHRLKAPADMGCRTSLPHIGMRGGGGHGAASSIKVLSQRRQRAVHCSFAI